MNSKPKTRGDSLASRARTRVLVMLLTPALVAGIVACDSGGNSGSGAQPTTAPAARAPYQGVPEGKPPGLGAPVPDPKEVSETLPAGQMPSFLNKLKGAEHDKAMALYQGAVDHYADYSHVPCYCGCAIYTTAHKSLADCYISSKSADGKITFTDHSTTCDLCQGAARLTLDGLAQNKPLKDVRAGIFKSLGYTGIWTDTAP
ncbi:MAG: PCYCGC domain-containing protein [Chloroflexota bacterium]|nr:PCYCGC domain-containing protein [Chloroflexota bacterium]